MAMIYATITGTITRPGSNVGVRSRITATPLTTNQALTFTGDDRITIGPETAETNGSGTLSTLKIPTNVDVGALLWRITAEALDRGPGPSRWTVKNAVAITGSSTIKLKDLVEVDVITVDAAIVTNVSALVADADSSKTAAAGSATAAAGSASAAATSASAAAGSATGASGSASAAATSASTASTKAGEASGSATAAAGSASAAAASASHADAMAGAAEAVAVSNDTIIAGRINDSASATAAALTASFEHKVPRTGATTGQVPALQADGSLAFTTVSGGGGSPTGAAGGSLAGTYPNPTLAAGAVSSAEINAAIKDAAAATASLRTLGTGAQQAAAGNHGHTADAITDGTTNKAYTATEKTKLAGVATGATANATDAQLRDRSTHTGNQPASTITGLATVATSGAYTDLSAKPTLGDAAAKNTGTTAGTLAAGDDTRLVNNAKSVQGGAEKSAALSATTGTATGDLSAASIFTVTPTGNITLAFSNVPATGTACTVTVIVSQGGTVRTVTPPTGTKWMGAAAPTQVANKACAFTFLTVDGGTTWYASAAVEQ